VKIAQGIPPAGVYISNFGKFSVKNVSFGGPMPLSLHRWGWNLVHSSVPNFIPIGATCRLCGAKNIKIGLWSTYIPALCAASNAAGNDHVQSEWHGAFTAKWAISRWVSENMSNFKENSLIKLNSRRFHGPYWHLFQAVI